MSRMLAKRLDSPQSPASRCQLPVRQKLVPVQGRPLDREAEGTRWEPPTEDFKAMNFYLSLELAVLSMKVRRPMIIEVHPDDDPEEPRNLGHRVKVRIGPCLGLTWRD